jgi:hypothetical protein
MKKIYSIPFIVAIAAIMLFGQGQGDFFGIKTAFGYGGGSSKTVVLNAPNSWAVISPSTKLSAFNYTSADITSILAYNAATKRFEVPSAGDILDPVNAFYNYPNKATSISFNYDAFAPGITSKNLSSGWNLVGTNSDGKAIDEFSTIQSSVSTLYIPGTLNGNKDVTGTSWGTDANRDLDKTSWSATKLSPYDGYWIYATSAATYEKILN